MRHILIIMVAIWFTSCQSGGKDNKESKDSSNSKEVGTNDELNNENSIKVGKGPDAMFLTPNQEKLYIANVGDTTISIINLKTEKVEKTIKGVRYPWGFSRLGNTNKVAVSAYDKQMVIIDFTTDQIIRERSFDTSIGGLVSSKEGKFIFIVGIDAKKVFKLEVEDLEIVDEFPTGNGPDGVGLSANGQNLYVTNTEDKTISVINTESKETKILKVGGKPELIHHNHDRSKLYISNFFENKIHIVDADKGEIIHEITGLDGPEEAVPNEDESLLYVVNFNIQKVFVYKTDDYQKLDIEYTTGKEPIGVTILQNKIYTTNFGDNSVSIIELK